MDFVTGMMAFIIGAGLVGLGVVVGSHNTYLKWYQKYDDAADEARRYKFLYELSKESE